MTFSVGDILHINSPIAGKKKYHICLGQNEFVITLCLFLNSKHGYQSDIVFDCSLFPMIPASSTGLSVVSLSMMPRYSEAQLNLYQAERIGVIREDVAGEILVACKASSALTKLEKAFAIRALESLLSN